MTLIQTAEWCGANSFDYLTELQRHVQKLQATPHVWISWSYRERLARSGLSDPVYICNNSYLVGDPVRSYAGWLAWVESKRV